MTLSPKPKRALEILNVSSPCSEPWDDMTDRGPGRRHCEMCMQDVYNLADMTQAEAEALVTADAGKLCVRFFRRADGTVVTSDCSPVRFRHLRAAGRGAMSLAARITTVAVVLLSALGIARASGFDPFEWIRGTAAGRACGMQHGAYMGEMVPPSVSAPAPAPAPAPSSEVL